MDTAEHMEQSDPRGQLRKAVTHWVDVTEAEWHVLSCLFTPQTFKAGAHVAQPGTGNHEVLFVSEGLLRFYYAGEDGTESNKAFVAENHFLPGPWLPPRAACRSTTACRRSNPPPCLRLRIPPSLHSLKNERPCSGACARK